MYVIVKLIYAINVRIVIHYLIQNVLNALHIVWNAKIKIKIQSSVINVLKAIEVMKTSVKNVGQIVKYVTLKMFIFLIMTI